MKLRELLSTMKKQANFTKTMTRINTIPPSKLTDKHLIAEHREIKRVPNVVKKQKEVKDIPETFRMGTGHVKFFYDKLGFLKNRYEEIYKECINRGFNVTYYGNAWDGVPEYLMNDWTPTEESIQLIEQRIKQRLDEQRKRDEERTIEKRLRKREHVRD
jgi:hypothetical protein